MHADQLAQQAVLRVQEQFWQALRRQVETRHAARGEQARFRRDPAAYLAALEDRLAAKPALPP